MLSQQLSLIGELNHLTTSERVSPNSDEHLTNS